MDNPYKRLAERLDTLPNGFPPTANGAEIDLLQKLFTPEEAALASGLRLTLETPEQISSRFEKAGIPIKDYAEFKKTLKRIARRGLIAAGKTDSGIGYGLLPFVVGIYEYQLDRMDAELAQAFEDYYQQAFSKVLSIKPSFHRVVPIEENIRADMEIQPFETASEIVRHAKSWGLLDCICRLQKKLIGDPCNHPIDVCMALSQRPGAFENNPIIRPLTQEEALATLRRSAESGLVHSVSNTQEEITYICNCCTCSCGILRGMAELGIANVVAHSPFVNHVDETLCILCEQCLTGCQFGALSLVDDHIQVDQFRCVGCGVCILLCEEGALALIRRPQDQIPPIPATRSQWLMERAQSRGKDFAELI